MTFSASMMPIGIALLAAVILAGKPSKACASSVQAAFSFAAAPLPPVMDANLTTVRREVIADEGRLSDRASVRYSVTEKLSGFLERSEAALFDDEPPTAIRYSWGSPDAADVVEHRMGSKRVVVFPGSSPTIAVEAEDSLLTLPSPISSLKDLCVAIVVSDTAQEVVVRSEPVPRAHGGRCGGMFDLALGVASAM